MNSVYIIQVGHKGEQEGYNYLLVSDYLIICNKVNCDCYPFVCFACKVCQERWGVQCRRGRLPTGVCTECYTTERELTKAVLKLGEWEISGFPLNLRKIYTRGVHPENFCFHSNEPPPFVAQIIKECCRRELKGVPCDPPPVKDKNWEQYKVRQEQGNGRSGEYRCCREDGLPRGLKHPSRRARQRGKSQAPQK